MRTKLSVRFSKAERIFNDHNKVTIVFFFCLLGPVFSDGIWSTTSGPLRATNALVDDVVAFLGIPYAEPPVGDLRFAKPLPKKQWTETYHASKISAPCTQIPNEPLYFWPDITNMSEDCLYLNMWVPKSRYYTKGLKPIIIFIHGGLFLAGSTNLKVYDGSKLAQKGDVIVATINYRLGSFGYLLGYIEEANGNMGMYDQIMAIKWIKDNALNFGGDPDNIVLMGESVGAASVSAHMVSPLSQHLFKRVIMQSGSIIVPNFQENDKLFKNSQTLASMMGCANETSNLHNDPHIVVECLKSKRVEDFMAAEKVLAKLNGMAFFPRINDDFLPKSSRDLLLGGKFRKDIDVLLGVNRDEGTMMLTVAAPEYFGNYGIDNIQSLNKRLATVLSQTFLTMVGYTNTSDIVNEYMKLVTNQSSQGYTMMIADIVGDVVIGCGTKFNAEIFSLKGNNVYFYNFEFRAASTPMAEWIGVTHMDELQYVFGNPFHDNFKAEEDGLSNYLIDRWSTFAKTGNPNIPGQIQWPRYSYHEPCYLNIGQMGDSLQSNPLDRCEIWRKRFKLEIDDRLVRSLQNSGMKRIRIRLAEYYLFMQPDPFMESCKAYGTDWSGLHFTFPGIFWSNFIIKLQKLFDKFRTV